MVQLTEEYMNISREFRKTFGYGVPLSVIPPTVGTDDLIEKIKECIDKKEDKLLEIYGIHFEKGKYY